MSRALRNDPTTSPKTREHVRKVALRLGYRPDPAMHVLIERRWRGRRTEEGLNLAYVYDSAGFDAKVLSAQFVRFRQMAASHGYSLIPADLRNFRTVHKFIRQLEVQGVMGVVFTLMPSAPYSVEEIARRFAAVSINVSTYQPSCPLVIHDEFRSIEGIWNWVQSAGYRRIGVIFEDFEASFSMNQRIGAVYCRQQFDEHLKSPIPIKLFTRGKGLDPSVIKKWVETCRPDVVIGDSHNVRDSLVDIGFRVPGDFAFATVNLWDPNRIGEIAGYFRDNVKLFERGLLLLNMMIRSGTSGARQGELIEMLSGDWHKGSSLPVRQTA